MPDHYPDTETISEKTTTTTGAKIKGASKLMGGSPALGAVGGDTKIGSLANITRRVTIRVGKVEKVSALNAEKITKLKNITKLRKENVDKKIGGSSPGLLKALEGIDDNVNGMLAILGDRLRFEKKVSADERKRAEQAKRGASEKKLESKAFEGLKQTAQKVLAPAMSLWDRLWQFLSTVLLGRVAVKLFEWLTDPENQDKVKAIGRLFKDWWPAMLTGFVLFGTGIGRFITWMGAKLVSWGWTLLKTVIPVLWKAITAMGPWGWAALGAVGVGAAIYGAGKMMGKDKVVENETERADTSREALEKAESTKDLSAGDREAIVQGTRLKDAGGGGSLNTMPDQLNDPLGLRQDPTGLGGGMGGMGGMRLNQGGQVPGSGNSDSVSAKLTPGEFVVSAPAVKQWGADTFASMNAMGGGGNTGSILRGFSEGGMVPFPEGSYKGESGQKWGDPRDYGGHVGIDITEDRPFNKDPKRPIYAPVKSKVLPEKFQRSGYTAGLMLDHLDGFQSRYVHMNPMKKPGDEVKPGDQIGKLKPLGRPPTWNSTHLHFELYKGSKLLNPTDFYKSLVDGSYQPSIARGVGDLNEVSSGEGDVSKSGGTWWNPFSWGKKSAATADNKKKGSASKGSSVEIPALKKYQNEEGGYDMDMLLGKKPSLSVPRAPNKPSTTVAYDQTMQDMAGGGQIPTRQSLPQIDASAMISRPKISTLGISV